MSKIRLLLLLLPTMMKMSRNVPIRQLVWAGLGVVAVAATLLAGLASVVVDLVSGWIGGGALKEAAGTATQLPVPEWLSAWIDPAWVRAMQSLAQQLLHLGGDLLPMLGQGIGLLTWLIWGLWAVLMLVLVFAGLKVHLLVGESQRGVTRQSAPSATSVSR